jgi:hypothetical protein
MGRSGGRGESHPGSNGSRRDSFPAPGISHRPSIRANRRRYPALDDHSVEIAKQLYGSGLILRDVGPTLGVHARTIRLALLRADVHMRDQQERRRA